MLRKPTSSIRITKTRTGTRVRATGFAAQALFDAMAANVRPEPVAAPEPLLIVTQADGTITCGPFTWFRNQDATGESWGLKLPAAGLTSFYIKDYGGEPIPLMPFSGWRVGSGGPFHHWGGWTSRDDALRGATPKIIEHYLTEADKELKAATAKHQALQALIERITPSI